MLILIVLLPPLLILIDFVLFLFKIKSSYSIITDTIGLVIYPLIYLRIFDVDLINNCCGDSATFSPEHRLTIYTWIFLYTISYYYSNFKKNETPPLLQVLLNTFIFSGIILNIFIALQVDKPLFIIGNIPIILILTKGIIENHISITQDALNGNFNIDNRITYFSYKILTSNIFIKFPILLALCFPLTVILSSILLLFGQQPDSLIRAFTDTYKHGFSELDYMCENVMCGEHYLCSVAANGSRKIVKPKRYGIRNNNLIICNRQLLISNAFEELIEKNFPKTHKWIRKNYDKVGDSIHNNYSVYNKKWVSNIVYLLMKPLEFFFWATLYLFEKKPENRISLQYVNKKTKQKILNHLK